MSEDNQLIARYPALGKFVARTPLAILPTPACSKKVLLDDAETEILVKDDGTTGRLYGGNKVRKLEYLLGVAPEKERTSVATFGAVGSNHALATALYARDMGLDCYCFLVHQPPSSSVTATLRRLLAIGTHIVRFGGQYSKRLQILRETLRGKRCSMIPAGGSSWRGNLGFVNAGLELAAQIEDGVIDKPDRIYIAAGTLGSSAGLSIGLALAGLDTEVHAVRVSMQHIANEERLERLIRKTVLMMHRIDSSIPPDLSGRLNIKMRHDFFAGGYAQSNKETDSAISIAREQLGLTLESTYTGKAMAALLHDLATRDGGRFLFWNTYNAIALPAFEPSDPQIESLPEEFRKYLA